MGSHAPVVPVPAADDRTLGRAQFVTLRLTLFASLEDSLPLRPIHDALSDTGHWDALCESFRSYHKDIVVPHATESSLPLVIMCEPFSEPNDGKISVQEIRPPRRLLVNFPSESEMDWEGTSISEQFTETGEPLRAPVGLVDSVTFFESGIIAYSLAIMFGENNGVDLNAQQLLAIGTLVNSPGRVKKGKVTYVPDTTAVSNGVPLPILIHDRIESLRFKRDIFGDGNSPRSIFTFLDQWAVRETGARKQAVSLQNALLSLGARAANSENEGKLDPTITASIGIEVIGAEWHERVLDYADKASRREARVDEFSRRLAGLAQNVFDFRRQDVEEVNDSLSSAVRIGNDITFAQREVAIRFIEESRAFSEMRCILGGSPYWLLVQLVLGHNERLLSHLNKEFETIRREKGSKGMIEELLTYSHAAEGSADDALEALDNRFRRRLQLVDYIPNIFRYPTEQRHYELLSRARGSEAQRGYLTALDDTIEKTFDSTDRERIAINNRRFDMSLQFLLGAIAMLQVGGSFASIIAIWPARGLGDCFLSSQCSHDNAGSRAFLLVVLVATALGLFASLFAAASLILTRRRPFRLRSSRRSHRIG